MCLVISYLSIDGKTALLCAAKEGQYEIVDYLLQFKKVMYGLKEQAAKLDSTSVRYTPITWYACHTCKMTAWIWNVEGLHPA